MSARPAPRSWSWVSSVISAAAIATEGARRFAAFLEHDADWPLLFFEFWAYGVRTPRLSAEFAKRRRVVHNAIGEVIGRAADALDLQLPCPPEQLAVGLGAAINGLAFERVADPGIVPDELYSYLVSALTTAIFAAATPRRSS